MYASLSLCGGGGGGARVRLRLSRPAAADALPEGPLPVGTVAWRLFGEYDFASKDERCVCVVLEPLVFGTPPARTWGCLARFSSRHRWALMLRAAEVHLQAEVGDRFVVRSSCGCGGWARVPWLVVSDPGESTQHGLYLQYLFAADMSAVYLSLGQGTTRLRTAFGGKARPEERGGGGGREGERSARQGSRRPRLGVPPGLLDKSRTCRGHVLEGGGRALAAHRCGRARAVPRAAAARRRL